MRSKAFTDRATNVSINIEFIERTDDGVRFHIQNAGNTDVTVRLEQQSLVIPAGQDIDIIRKFDGQRPVELVTLDLQLPISPPTCGIQSWCIPILPRRMGGHRQRWGQRRACGAGG